MTEESGWIEIRITMDPAKLELLSPGLFALGCQGIEEQEKGFRLYFSSDEFGETTEARLRNLLSGADHAFGEESIQKAIVPVTNWNEQWKESFRPFRAAPGLIIQPDWESVEPGPDEQVITIAPKMAFGTGHHETTRLVLQLIPHYIKPGADVLDLGTGSGILAIYARKCGAGSVTGVDNDPEAIRNFRENCALNHISAGVTPLEGTLEDLPEGRRFDLILANINRNVLLELAGRFETCAGDRTVLILSGILDSDAGPVKRAYEKTGWIAVGMKRDGEWVGVVFERQLRSKK